MALQKLQFRPGVIRDVTGYTNEGGWRDSNLIRFRLGFPQSIGGWIKYASGNPFLGICRSMLNWVTLIGSNLLAFGTNLKYYVEEGGTNHDITPIRKTVTLNNPFTATTGSSVIAVYEAAHGCVNNDYVTFSGATSLGGTITATVLNKEFQITYVDLNNYKITVSATANASDTGHGGSAVVAAYQINTGLNTQIGGNGWGAGTWGRGTWGSGATTSASNTLRLWAQDNYGEDLVFNVRNGGVYYWYGTNPSFTRGVTLASLSTDTQTPTLALQVIVSDRDRHVIALGANYGGVTDMALACDGTPVIVICKEEVDFRLTPEALEAAITPATRWLVFNSPTNPTGTTYTTDQLRALAAVLVRHPQVMVLADDIYEHIRFAETDRPRHLLEIEPSLRDRTLIVNGVSKTYAMTGWRVGYAVGPADIIAAMDMLQSQSTSGACSISQSAAVTALNSEADFLPGWVALYKARRDTAVRMLNDIPGIRCRAPGGAFYLYPWCGGLIGRRTPEGKTLESDLDVVIYLLEAGSVMVLAGSAYGVSPYFRMSIATSVELIEEGCRRISRAIEALA